MIKYFGKAFKITNDNIILATPLVLFLLFLSIYIGVAQNAPVNILSTSLLSLTVILMLSAFFAGWFYMVRRALELDKQNFSKEDDKAKASFNLIKEFPVGIGEYFSSFIGVLLIYVVFLFVVYILSFQIGLHFVGKVGVSLAQLKLALLSPAAMKSLLTSMSTEQLKKLNEWNFLFMITTAIYSFLTMFWGAEVIFRTRNAFLALFRSMKFTLKNFLPALILFIYVSAINFVVSLINALSTLNPIIYFISMLVYFYFLVYIIVLVFLYYDQTMLARANVELQAEVEETIIEKLEEKNNSDSGADSDGQEQSGDSDSKEE